MSDLLHFSNQIQLVVLVVLVSLVAAFAARRSRPWVFGIAPAPACLAIGSVLAIAAVTLTPQANTREPGRLQLHPFATIDSYLDDPSALVIYVLGNLALFVPLGFCTHLALRRSTLIPAALCGLAAVTVEVLQLPIWSRSTDVDDVLLNTIGGLTGVALAAVVLAAVPPRRWPGSGTAGRRAHNRPLHPDAGPETTLPTLLPLSAR